MAVSLEAFVKHLTDSGIIAPGQLENFIPPKAQPKDAQELARQLVQNKHLTKFQAQEIYAGRQGSLILGNYTLVDRIGAGGMGQVFKAQHRRMERIVAIKMLPPAMTKAPLALARFLREVKAASRLLHPNIVSAFDADESNGVHFLVMEYVEGADLSALVKRDGPLSVAKTVRCVLQAARGLEFAHGEGVIHRDIKPANLLLDKKGVVKILDMGLARIEQAGGAVQAELTGTGAIMGTVDYMAPEQGMSTKHADARADIYSLGCSLYYLLGGKSIYDGETVAAKLVAHHNTPIPDLRQTNPDVSAELEAVFRKMVAKQVEVRYQTMTEVVADLERIQSGQAVSSTTIFSASGTTSPPGGLKDAPAAISPAAMSPAAPGPAGKPKLSRPATIGLVAAGVVGAAILAGVLLNRKTSDDALAGKVDRSGANGSAANVPVPPAGQAADEDPDRRAAEWVLSKRGALYLDSQKGEITDRASLPAGAFRIAKISLNRNADHHDRELVTDDELVALENLKSLTTLNLGEQKLITDDGAKSLQSLKALNTLYLSNTQITNTSLGYVKSFPALRMLNLVGTVINDDGLLQLHGQKSLVSLLLARTRVTASGVTALQKSLPDCRIEWPEKGQIFVPGAAARPLAFYDPAFEQWVKTVQAMPAEKQVSVVAKKLMDLNPGFDGKLTEFQYKHRPKIENGVVTEVAFLTDKVQDISPVRALANLRILNCKGSEPGTGQLSDLAPLAGMPLVVLGIYNTAVDDLSPLRGMPLTTLNCTSTPLSDVSPLQETPITYLNCDKTRLSDLAPLHRCTALKSLSIKSTPATPGGVAALQQALPNCKIEWDEANKTLLPPGEGGRRPDEGAQPWNSPAFEQWVKAVQAMPADKQVEAVAKKLMDLNPGFDGGITHTLDHGVISELGFVTDNVTDISPVRALASLKSLSCGDSGGHSGILADLSPLRGMRLETLKCGGTKIADLSPLEGMPLTTLRCNGAKKIVSLEPLRGMRLVELNCGSSDVSDLSPLEGMPLTALYLYKTNVSSLAPLRGMKLRTLRCETTQVTELGALRGMPLEQLDCSKTGVSDVTPLQACAKLTTLALYSTKATATGVATLQKALPDCRIEWPEKGQIYGQAAGAKPLAFTDPAFQQWMKAVAAMPAEKQVEAVAKKLMELNPGSDDKVTNKIENNVVTSLELLTDSVLDISPVRALTGLKVLNCSGTYGGPGRYISNFSDLSPLQGMPLTTLICLNTPVSTLSPLKGMPLMTLNVATTQNLTITQVADLSPLRGMPLTELNFYGTHVSDLSPLRGMPLKKLSCGGTQIRDLSPLEGMKLTFLDCAGAPVSDLSPLRGMSLTFLNCHHTQVSDLTPLKGMPLTTLWCFSTKVSDLSPLDGMSLNQVIFTPTNIANGLDKIRQMKTLTRIGIDQGAKDQFPPADFWKKYDAGEFGKPVARPVAAPAPRPSPIKGEGAKAWNTPEFEQWMKAVQALPAEKQVEAVAKKLVELNPGFDGQVTGAYRQGAPRIENGVVTELGIYTDNVTDISPMRALQGLKNLNCNGNFTGGVRMGKLSSLAPLKGLPLTALACSNTQVMDLSPLEGMPLTNLVCGETRVADLSPLKGMQLTILSCYATNVSDLSPLRGMPLASLMCNGTKVSDLAPLAGMPLTSLSCSGAAVSDLSPLKGMRLTTIECDHTQVSDLSPLEGMPLTKLCFSPETIAKGIELFRKMASLKVIGNNWQRKDQFPADEFWRKYDAGELGKPVAAPAPAPSPSPQPSPIKGEGAKAWNTPEFQQWMKDVAALPAEKQVEAVAKKLRELNPGFDGNITGLDGTGAPKIAGGVVAEIGFVTDQVMDISPVRALTGLRALSCKGSKVGLGKLADLRPLEGMSLQDFNCSDTRVADLSPLAGMKLRKLRCGATPITDLGPLSGMPLTLLWCSKTGVSNLEPLRGMRLTDISIHDTPIADLSPLRGMPVTGLNCYRIKASDLSPLEGMSLPEILITPSNIRQGMEVLRGMKSLVTIGVDTNKLPAAEFWQRYDAGEFGKPAPEPSPVKGK